eukprot:Plantae.Rhodophyta-Purpureofilum_apyrenoidigerum.ctg5807.p1 GENE.Plantae.Rhodophyta-Purpureofilum_apyrenoidigerum.ctg5807~~Plantae.Rhodophyta-Purpureofilum_apyrenoidigerum.ctg5807.p1  ORF type:complete len:369 (+),score=85.75 Plantae.Rhodophyta-Purpureofilum_apyrenoidigerum.ctg5807:84-1190(+)
MVITKKVALGKQGLEVSELGYGCMGLTSFYGSKLSHDDVVAMLKKVYENGVNFWDTANVYVYMDKEREKTTGSPFVCQEEIIGRAIKEVGRENIVIATKTGLEFKMAPSLEIAANGSPEFLRKQCEASLSRLGVDYLDLFYLHRIDQNIPIEVSVQVLRELVLDGKVKYIGLSECSAKTLRRAHKVHPITCIQVEYSLWSRDIEDELIPTCAELGVGIVAYSPLGRGFFSDEVTKDTKYESGDFRASQPRMTGENLTKNFEALERVKKIAEKKGCQTSQLALAWVKYQSPLLKGAGLVAIPGTTKEKNLLSNVDAMDLTLTVDEIATLQAAIKHDEVAGDRYEPGHITHANDNNKELSREEAEEYYLS